MVGDFYRHRNIHLGLPAWARGILFVVMIPGILLVGLSLLLVLISILALLILTVPAFLLLRQVAGVKESSTGPISNGTKRVEATIVNDRPV